MTLVDNIGCWARVRSTNPDRVGGPALFLDRDGVVVEEVGFLSRPEDVRLAPGAAALIAACNAERVQVIVVTNQSGIARGLLTWEDFERVEAEIERQLRQSAGAQIDAVFACGYHPAGTGALGREHPWRKPGAGMIDAATESLGVHSRASWIVGDRARDLEAGRAGGLAGGIHVMTGHADAHQRSAAVALSTSRFAVKLAQDVSEALPIVEALMLETTC